MRKIKKYYCYEHYIILYKGHKYLQILVSVEFFGTDPPVDMQVTMVSLE